MKQRWFLIALVALVILVVLMTKLLWPKPSGHVAAVVLVSDRPWPVGEARPCDFAEKVNAASCLRPIATLGAPSFEYMVAIDFDRRLEFKDGWAKDVTCRLDSFEHATCKQYALEGR